MQYVPVSFRRLLLAAALQVIALAAWTLGGTVLVGHGRASEWRYLDSGSPPGDGWREAGFDDASWKAGPGPLGYNADMMAASPRIARSSPWSERAIPGCGSTSPSRSRRS